LTWVHSHVSPGNENLLGHADGTMPVIFGSHTTVAGFDFFNENEIPLAVCDIDACFTN
jgi:hypothetical protein